MPARIETIGNGYRLSNDRIEAIISVAGSVGLTHLASRGPVARETINIKEEPIKLRLATAAERIDFIDWEFHAGSGTALPPEDEWGYQLGLHKSPAGGGARVQRLTDTLLGPPWYTDIYYPGYAWFRQTVTLPKSWQGKPIVFVLGGADEYDWRDYWIYLNGNRVGQASHDDTYVGKWHEIHRYAFKPDDPNYAKLKFGEPNSLAVQARRLDRRTPGMHRLDLERYSGASLLVDQYVCGGEPTRDVTDFKIVSHSSAKTDEEAAVELVLASADPMISIVARYSLAADESALHKRITVRNEGNDPITLLEADVMKFDIGNTQTAAGGQGWPIRIGEDWFAGIAHPAGVARSEQTFVRLQVNPGAVLDPAHSHDYVSKTAVVGVGDGRRAFANYLQSRGKRKPQFLRLYSLYGLCEIASGLYPQIELTESLLLNSIAQLQALKKKDIRFDYYCIDTGWNDPVGDLKQFHPKNFPNGSDRSFREIHDLHLKPLLWISPAQGPPAFRFGTKNPLLKDEDNIGASWFLCVEAPRWRSMLREAMLHHVHQNGVRGYKLDEVSFYCGRSSHGHLPNKYGTEQEMDAFIDTLESVRKECPEVLLMLYWRFMSPWWLLHVDTIYQRGLQMEGATPSPLPSRITRQSVTSSLDQGHDLNWDTMPLISQDSLGVWLSNTRWGSWMGAEGWRDAWVMDFIRGNMMHQLWGDLSLLHEEDHAFMAAIATASIANADLLQRPRRILGSPWIAQPYGYACCEGDRGIIAINNNQFPADAVSIPLDESIGLNTGPHTVRWVYKSGSVKETPTQTIAAGDLLKVPLGSFEVCLAEIVPAEITPAEVVPAQMAATRPAAIPSSLGPTRILARMTQMSCVDLNWNNPAAQKRLALVVNGRTMPTRTPDVLAVGPDRSDERDRDIVTETRVATVVLPSVAKPTKLLVVARLDRDGIAWHHLAPFEIIHVTAAIEGNTLEVMTNPRRWHEQAGGWSWVLHTFGVPAGAGSVMLHVDATRPKNVNISYELWHNNE